MFVGTVKNIIRNAGNIFQLKIVFLASKMAFRLQ